MADSLYVTGLRRAAEIARQAAADLRNPIVAGVVGNDDGVELAARVAEEIAALIDREAGE